MLVKLFTKKDCPNCPAAKKVYEVVKATKPTGTHFKSYDVESVDGMAEAAFYTVMSTPTILVCDDNGKESVAWRGAAPVRKELVAAL